MTPKVDTVTPVVHVRATKVDSYLWSLRRVINCPRPVASQYIRTCKTSEIRAKCIAPSRASRIRNHLDTVCRLTLHFFASVAALIPCADIASRSLVAKQVTDSRIYHFQHFSAP